MEDTVNATYEEMQAQHDYEVMERYEDYQDDAERWSE